MGFLHTINDDYADAVKADEVNILYGRDYFYEKLHNLKFKISPLSFFQVNTKAAEKLYQIVIDYLEGTEDEKVYDLYSGQDATSQIIAPYMKEVIGIELDANAVQKTKENAELNNIDICKLMAWNLCSMVTHKKKLA